MAEEFEKTGNLTLFCSHLLSLHNIINLIQNTTKNIQIWWQSSFTIMSFWNRTVRRDFDWSWKITNHFSTLLTLFNSISRPPTDAILCRHTKYSTKLMDTHNRMKTEQIGCSLVFYKCGLWSYFEVFILVIIMMYTQWIKSLYYEHFNKVQGTGYLFIIFCYVSLSSIGFGNFPVTYLLQLVSWLGGRLYIMGGVSVVELVELGLFPH